jgi:hypothetical protein
MLARLLVGIMCCLYGGVGYWEAAWYVLVSMLLLYIKEHIVIVGGAVLSP